jgi:hypothetical protein
MTYTASSAPDITEGIPTAFSLATKASSQVFSGKGRPYDIAIGGIAFILGATAQHIYQRETAQIQKQQIDTSKEAGEQTLDGYWIRSQTSWHMGAGIRYYEPGSQPDTEYRFEDSLGVNVWTKDKATLLHACTPLVTGIDTAYAVGAVIAGANVLFTNENGAIKRRSSTGALLQAYDSGVTTATYAPVVGAGRVFADAASFGLKSSDATVGTTLSTLYTQTSTLTPRPFWAKDRLIVARGPALYELAPDGSSGTTPGDLETVVPMFTHPDPGWTWTGVTEGPNNIYAAGYSNGASNIYKFVLEDAGINNTGLPKLSQGYSVFSMPHGEQIYTIHASMGRYLAVGSSKGFRVGLISTSNYITLAGELQMGPLLFYTANPVQTITSSDRFFYVGVQGGYAGILEDPYNTFTGAIRVDLGEMVGGYQGNSIRFPWASDAQPGANGRIDSITVIGNTSQVAFGIYQHGIYGQSATLYEKTGWIRSGRIRYSTVQPKTFRLLDLGLQVFTGSVDTYSVDALDNELYLRTIDAQANDSSVALHTQVGTYEFLRFRTALNASADQLTSPSLNSMQVRALPAIKRQRMIQLPLLCMDYEMFATSPKIGYEGFAITRLKGLEAIEETGMVVVVQDFTTDETFEAVIEKISFTRPGPRSTDGRHNFGGFLDVLVRKL